MLPELSQPIRVTCEAVYQEDRVLALSYIKRSSSLGVLGHLAVGMGMAGCEDLSFRLMETRISSPRMLAKLGSLNAALKELRGEGVVCDLQRKMGGRS